MALVKAGWWQTTWWPSQWWHEDWWLEYGTVTPAVGGVRSRALRAPVVVKRLPLDEDTLRLFKQYLELKLKNA